VSSSILKQIKVRLSLEEKKYIEWDADRRGMSATNYCSTTLNGCGTITSMKPPSRIKFESWIMSILGTIQMDKQVGKFDWQNLEALKIAIERMSSAVEEYEEREETKEKPARGKQACLMYLDLDEETVDRLEELSAKANVSRNTYIRSRLINGKKIPVLAAVSENINVMLEEIATELMLGQVSFDMWMEKLASKKFAK
jgi:predicted HicB family RNase H-like nuclease